MSSDLHAVLRRFAGTRVTVWGDLILDEYIYTSAGRVSREAPVLITEFERRVYHPGGAGNVVMNLLALGAVPVPVGVIGRDREGDRLVETLTERGVAVDRLIRHREGLTPVKSRIMAGGENTRKQQILRIDTLDRTPLAPRVHSSLRRSLLAALDGSQALVLSDYLARSVSPTVAAEVRRRSPASLWTLDSRRHLRDFAGVDVATPNEPEIREAYPRLDFQREESFLEAGADLSRRLCRRGLVLKRGHLGMIVFDGETPPVQVPIHGTSQIVDGTGAGDTVIAVLTLALAVGASLLEAARIASVASGLVVMHEGAYAVSYRELASALG